MRNAQSITDQLAIGLSSLCAIHCLVLPILLTLLPSLTGLPLESEAFHVWMVIAVVPTSIYGLTMGCKQHKRYPLLGLGMIGITLLLLAIGLGEDRIGEIGEKGLTLLGAFLVATGHWFNYKLCKAAQDKDCSCSNSN